MSILFHELTSGIYPHAVIVSTQLSNISTRNYSRIHLCNISTHNSIPSTPQLFHVKIKNSSSERIHVNSSRTHLRNVRVMWLRISTTPDFPASRPNQTRSMGQRTWIRKRVDVCDDESEGRSDGDASEGRKEGVRRECREGRETGGREGGRKEGGSDGGREGKGRGETVNE